TDISSRASSRCARRAGARDSCPRDSARAGAAGSTSPAARDERAPRNEPELRAMSEPLRVLHADNHLLVLDKPAGGPSVPGASGDESLLDRAREWVRVEYAKKGDVFLGVVQRLDRPVSGVIVFARTSKAAARLVEQQKDGRLRKKYWGVGIGRPPEREGELEQ